MFANIDGLFVCEMMVRFGYDLCKTVRKIIIGIFLIGMLPWWGYKEYKVDNPDD